MIRASSIDVNHAALCRGLRTASAMLHTFMLLHAASISSAKTIIFLVSCADLLSRFSVFLADRRGRHSDMSGAQGDAQDDP